MDRREPTRSALERRTDQAVILSPFGISPGHEVPGESEAVISVVSRERSANWQGNILLAAIGILGPFFVALVGAAFRSWRRSRPER
jgi:hypothetical protein